MMNLLTDSAASTVALIPTPNPKAVALSPGDAARSLARLPRRVRRKRSGYIRGERVWRNREIELPDGRRAFVYGALRGKVGWSLHPIGVPVDGDHLGNWGVSRQEAVRLVKNPHAQLLGRRKAGVRERPSAAKAAAARINGRMPPRPGSRPRGRPRALGVPSLSQMLYSGEVRIQIWPAL